MLFRSFWKRSTGHGAFSGLLSGTVTAALTHGLTVAEGKGGWIAASYTFPSSMAQNFWMAIFAWVACFTVTIAVSMVTAPKPESELKGLVYSLTTIPGDEHEPWYRRPGPLAVLVLIGAAILNVMFW